MEDKKAPETKDSSGLGDRMNDFEFVIVEKSGGKGKKEGKSK